MTPFGMMRRGFVRRHVPGPVHHHARPGAAAFQQFAVHMDQLKPGGWRRLFMRPVVQIIDVLRHKQEVAFPPCRQVRQRPVRRIGPHLGQLSPPLIIEVLHQRRIDRIAFGRRHILDPMPAPQPVRRPKGRHAALGRYPGSGQDDEVCV
jgi:hypothetical protein